MTRALELLLCALAALLVIALYFGWQTDSFVEAEDSIVYAGNILRQDPQLNPHHLFFEPLYAAVASLFPGLGAIVVMQGLTAAFAVIALLAVFGLVAPRKGLLVGLVATLLVAQLYAFWHYAKVVDAYVPGLALALCALIAFEHRARLPAPVVAPACALALSGAVLMHQLYIFLAPIFALALLLDRRSTHRVRDALVYSALGLVIVSSIYIGAYLATATGSPGGFVGWVLGHARGGLWDPPGGSTPLLAIFGIASVFVTTSPIFASPAITSRLEALVGGRSLVEEAFLAQQAFPGPVAVTAALVALALLFVGYLGLVVYGFIRRSALPLTGLEWVLVASVASYAALVVAWEAANREFWIHVVVFAIVLFFLRTDWSRPALGTAAAVVGLGAALNFFGGIKPLSDARNDYWALMTEAVTGAVAERGLILSECSWLCQRYASRTDHEYLFSSSWQIDAALERISGRDDGDAIYLVEWAIAAPNRLSPDQEGFRDRFLSHVQDELGPFPEAGAPDPLRTPAIWRWRGAWELVAEGRAISAAHIGVRTSPLQ